MTATIVAILGAIAGMAGIALHSDALAYAGGLLSVFGIVWQYAEARPYVRDIQSSEWVLDALDGNGTAPNLALVVPFRLHRKKNPIAVLSLRDAHGRLEVVGCDTFVASTTHEITLLVAGSHAPADARVTIK